MRLSVAFASLLSVLLLGLVSGAPPQRYPTLAAGLPFSYHDVRLGEVTDPVAWVTISQEYLDLVDSIHGKFAGLSKSTATLWGPVEFHHIYPKCSVWPRPTLGSAELKIVSDLNALLTLRVRLPGELQHKLMYVHQECKHLPKKLHAAVHTLLFVDNPGHFRMGFAATMMMGAAAVGAVLWARVIKLLEECLGAELNWEQIRSLMGGDSLALAQAAARSEIRRMAWVTRDRKHELWVVSDGKEGKEDISRRPMSQETKDKRALTGADRYSGGTIAPGFERISTKVPKGQPIPNTRCERQYPNPRAGTPRVKKTKKCNRMPAQRCQSCGARVCGTCIAQHGHTCPRKKQKTLALVWSPPAPSPDSSFDSSA